MEPSHLGSSSFSYKNSSYKVKLSIKNEKEISKIEIISDKELNIFEKSNKINENINLFNYSKKKYSDKKNKSSDNKEKIKGINFFYDSENIYLKKKNKSLLKEKEGNSKKSKASNRIYENNYNIKKNKIEENNKIGKNYNISSFESSDLELFGLKNLGFSCYVNSFLQILLRTPMFIHYIKQSYIKNNSQNLLLKILLSLSNKENQKKNLKFIKETMAEKDPSFGRNEQNDSQEFGIALIDKIISIIKEESLFSDDDEEDYKETTEKIPFSKLGEIKNEKYKEYIAKYHNKEIPLEKMFQFYESHVKIDINNEIKKISFETFLNIELSFPDKNEYKLEELLRIKYPLSIDFILKLKNLSEYNKKRNEYDSFESKNENKEENEKDQSISKEVRNEQRNENNKVLILEIITNFLKKIFIGFWENIKNYFLNSINNEDNNNNKNKILTLSRIVSLPNVLIISINRALIDKPFNKNILKFKESLDIYDYIDEFILKEEKDLKKRLNINYMELMNAMDFLKIMGIIIHMSRLIINGINLMI